MESDSQFPVNATHKFCQNGKNHLSKLWFFKSLDSNVRFQIFFAIKEYLKVLWIKGFVKFSAGTTELYLVEISIFQPLILANFWLFRTGFFA